MFKKSWITAVLAATFIGGASIASAATVSIEFEGSVVGGDYVEDGFLFDDVIGSVELSSNALTEFILFSGETLSITQTNGEDFALVSFDYGNPFSNGTIDAFDLLGFNDGVEVVDYGNFVTSGGAVATGFGDDTVVDQIFIVGTDFNTASPYWDNFVFETDVAPIPLPAGAWLLITGLLGLGALRRRRAAAA